MDALSKIGFWNKVPVKDRTFHSMVEKVLPDFWQMDEMKNMTKTAIHPKLKSYLEKVCNIADDKEEYDFSSANNSSSMMPLDNYGKLEFFINYQKTSILSDKWEKGKKWGKAMQAIFVSNGTVIANRQRYNIDSEKQTDENGEEDDTLSISIDEDEDNQVEM